MDKKWRIRLSGTGGQGVIKGAMILAEAALLDGRNATQSQVYGPESRGGSTRAEVNIADSRILYPKVEIPNLLLCLSPEAYQKYIDDVSDDAIIILDGDLDQGALTRPQVYRLPITEIARDKLGKEVAANVVALGVINGITGILSDEAVNESLARSFSEKILDVNRQAYQLGLLAGKAARE